MKVAQFITHIKLKKVRQEYVVTHGKTKINYNLFIEVFSSRLKYLKKTRISLHVEFELYFFAIKIGRNEYDSV